MLPARNEGLWWFCSTKLLFFFLISFLAYWFNIMSLIFYGWFLFHISSWLVWLRKGCRLFNSIVIRVCCYPQSWQSLNLQFICHSFLCIEEAAAEKTGIPPYRLNNVISLLSTGSSWVAVCTLSLQKIIIYCYRVINFLSSDFLNLTTKLHMQVSKHKETRLYFYSCLLFFITPEAGQWTAKCLLFCK